MKEVQLTEDLRKKEALAKRNIRHEQPVDDSLQTLKILLIRARLRDRGAFGTRGTSPNCGLVLNK